MKGRGGDEILMKSVLQGQTGTQNTKTQLPTVGAIRKPGVHTYFLQYHGQKTQNYGKFVNNMISK